MACCVQEKLPRRAIVFPKKLSCYKKLSSGSEDDVLDNFCLPKKRRLSKKKRKRNSNVSKTHIHKNNVTFCNACARNGDSKENAEKQVTESVIGAILFTCIECKKAFRSKDTLYRHKISHSGSKPFSCDICKQELSSAVSLREHIAKHENKKPYECDLCHTNYRHNSSYKRHLLTHLKYFPYVCDICCRRFARKVYLRSHMTIHTGEKNFSCEYCNKSFAHRSDLNRHKILHTGKRPFKCDICNATFADCSSYRRHKKDHEKKSQANMHICEMCSIPFKTGNELNQHTIAEHNFLATQVQKSPQIVNSEELSAANSLTTNKQSVQNYLHSEILNDAHADKSEHHAIVNIKINGVIMCNKSLKNEVPFYTDMQSNTTNVSNSGLLLQNQNVLTQAELISKELCSNSNELVTRHQPFLENYNNLDALNITSENNQIEFDILKNATEKLQNYQSYYPSENFSNTVQTDYIMFPDFNNQDYYAWLSSFTSLCKLLTFPIELELFCKISHVYKSISDALAEPSGLLCDRINFLTLMNFAKELLVVTTGHLTFVYQQMQD